VKQLTVTVTGLDGKYVDASFRYMVAVINGNDEVQTVKAIGMNSTVPMSTMSVPDDIEERFPQARGLGDKLAKMAKEVELLIGMDNQGWMPRYTGESLVEWDNLRLMHSVLGLACILIRSSKESDPGDGTQGSARVLAEEESLPGKVPVRIEPRRRGWSDGQRQERLLTDCIQKMLAVMLVLLAMTREASAFQAYDCNNQSARAEQYPLLDLEPCGNMEKVHTTKWALMGRLCKLKRSAW
jgi:hypothetical protein